MQSSVLCDVKTNQLVKVKLGAGTSLFQQKANG